jgi:hypothetical protein
MINPGYARLERGCFPGRQGRPAAPWLPGLLALVLLLGPAACANGQSFVFLPVSPKTVGVGSNLTFTLSVAPVPLDGVVFGHGGAAPPNSFPVNASLDLTTGVFAWTPTQDQLGLNLITVWAFETTQAFNSNYTTFAVTVTNTTAPVSGIEIDPIPPQTVLEGKTLIFTNHARATDDSTRPLVFSLVNAPSGATLTNNSSTSGIFTWTPTSAQAAIPIYTIREVVTAQSGSGSNYQDFQVTVTRTNNCAQLDELLAAIQAGGYFMLSNCATLVLSNALTIANNVTLDAGTNRVTIAGAGQDRLFTVLSGVTNFTLKGLILSGGQSASGGALYISAGAQVRLTNCVLAGNSAVGASGTDGKDGNNGVNGGDGGNGTAASQALGGAIHNLGTVMAFNTQFLTNRTGGGNGGNGGNGGAGDWRGGSGGKGGAGALGYGGAIYNLGTLVLTNCTFSGNTATGGAGGAGGAAGDGLPQGNTGRGAAGAAGWGAAVYSGQWVGISACTFSGNTAQSGNSAAGGMDPSTGNGVDGPRGPDSFGGAVYLQGGGSLDNCTFNNNTAIGGDGGNGGDAHPTSGYTAGDGGDGGNGTGGGLYNAGTVAVANCTFAACGAVGGGNGVAGISFWPANDGVPGRGRGGDIANVNGSFSLRSSILAASSAGTNAYDTSASRITDAGFNISSDASLNLSGTSLKSTDPKLSALASNGGPTQTMALQGDSPAVNRVPSALSPPTDQRGVPRPQGAAGDVGAYELVTVPVILAQPRSQTNANGTPVTFTISVVGDSLNYQWRFNAAAITNATAASYTIASAATNNVGTYDVVITNSYGAVTSAPATLTVIFPPTITTQPTNVSVLQGSNATFAVQATGLAPLSYQWRLNGTNIPAASTNSYTVINAQPGAAGTYTVLITNLHGSVMSSPATLTVNVPPSVTTPPASQTVSPGSYVAFSVVATGTLPLSYQWRFNGSKIPGAASSSYAITNAQATNTGTYDVLVTNSYGSISSPPAFLFVVQPFAISGRVLDANGTSGLAGVLIEARTNSGVAATTRTDTSGNFVLSGLGSNTYALVASQTCYLFTPASMNLVVGPTNAVGIVFTASNDYHRISGWVTNAPAVFTVTCTDTNGRAVTNQFSASSSPASYMVSNLCAGSYTVEPSAGCANFTPPTHTNVTVGPGDATGVSFLAVPDLYTIGGFITDGVGGVSGVQVTAAGATTTNYSTFTTNGSYLLNVCPGHYTLTPTQACRLFSPASWPVDVGLDTNQVNFFAYSDALSVIRGQVTDGVNGLANVPITATGGRTAFTDASGNYSFSSLCPGTYTLTLSVSNRCPETQSSTITVGSAQTTDGVSFVAAPAQYHISGTLGGLPAGPPVAIRVVGVGRTNLLFTSTGTYGLSNLCSGTYTVTPSNACYQFYPASRTTTLGPSIDTLAFSLAGGGSFSLEGRVTSGGVGLSNVTVTAAGQTTTTGPDGKYRFAYLCSGTSVVVAPSLPGYAFRPTVQSLVLSSNTTLSDFRAFPSLAITRTGNGAVQLTFTPTFTCQVQAAANLTNWQPVFATNNLSSNPLPLQFTDTAATNLPMRFYRFAETFTGAPVITNCNLAGHTVSLNCLAAPVVTCQIMASMNLSSWTPIFSTNLPASAAFQFRYEELANPPARYYRLSQTAGF